MILKKHLLITTVLNAKRIACTFNFLGQVDTKSLQLRGYACTINIYVWLRRIGRVRKLTERGSPNPMVEVGFENYQK